MRSDESGSSPPSTTCPIPESARNPDISCMSTACRRLAQIIGLGVAVAAVAMPSVAGAAGAVAASAKAASDRCGNANVVPDEASADVVKAATLCLINAQRSARGLRPLRAEPSLSRVATGFAQLMARQRFFDHTSPRGSTLLSRVKASSYLERTAAWTLGENIAWATNRRSTPGSTVRSWMDSPPHRANILAGHFREIGIGIAAGGGPSDVNPDNAGTTYVADFGHRTSAAYSAKRPR